MNSLEHLKGPDGGIAMGLIIAGFVLIIILIGVLVWALKKLRQREVVGGIAMQDMPRNENHYCTVE